MSSYFSPRLFSFSSITGFLPCLVRIGPCCFTFCKQRGRVWFSQGFVTNGPGIAPKTPALDHVGGGQDWKELTWCLPLVPSPSNCFVPLPELHAGSSRRFLGRPLPSPRGIPAAFLPAGLCSPLSSDPQEEKRRWAQKPSPLREGGQQPRVSVPSPRLIHLLFQTLCLPLLWVNPYLATPGVRKAGEGITAVRSPPALACPTRFWGKNREGWSRLCLLIEHRALPSQAASKESPAAGFPHTALTFTATCNLAVFLEGPDASKVLPSISTDIVKMGA